MEEPRSTTQINQPAVPIPAVEMSGARPALGALYAMYGYTPSPALAEKPLAFEWNREQAEKMHEAICKILSSFPELIAQRDEEVKFDNNIVFKASNTNTCFEASLWENDSLIADFEFRPDGPSGTGNRDHWVLFHRLVAGEYRAKNVGSKMLGIVERGLQYIAKKNNKTEVLEIQAQQLGIINFALKNGYILATPEDRENLKLIDEGDRSKILIRTEWSGGKNAPKLGFIYSIQTLQELAQKCGMGHISPDQLLDTAIAEEVLIKSHSFYQKDALAVKFIKEITAEM